jgi:cytochrome c oxidase assembly protein subunit 15
LGCPDWPGCYGKLSPVHAQQEIAQAIQTQGGEHGPVSAPKAWKEMVHRYIAAFLGLLIIILAVMAYRQRKPLRQKPWLAISLVGVVCLQGAFGAWTVTLLLKPAIVTGHLIGGLTLLGLLTWLLLKQTTHVQPVMPPKELKGLRWLARLGLLVVSAQIVLGGWVSTNYAALACADFPTCQGQWWPEMQFVDAFHVMRKLGKTSAGDMLAMPALTAIHWVHRLGACLVTGVVVWLGIVLWRHAGLKLLAISVWFVLALQILLGISNVVFRLPLFIAVLHNGGAAVLLMTLIFVNYRLASQVQHS